MGSTSRRDALARAIKTAETLAMANARDKTAGTVSLRVATPVTTKMHGGFRASEGDELRSPLATLSPNARAPVDEGARGRAKGERVTTRGVEAGKSRLARSTSASDEETRAADRETARRNAETFEPVESVDEVLARMRLKVNETQRKEFAKIYDECLEAKSLRVAIENVKDTELRVAHREALRMEEFVRASVDAHDKKDTAIAEASEEISSLKARARESEREVRKLKAENEELARALRLAKKTASPGSKKLVSATTQTSLSASTQTRDGGQNDQLEALRRELTLANSRVESELRQHDAEFMTLNDELTKARDAMRALERDLTEAKDASAFYQRCSNTADERANVAEETACALREEVLETRAEMDKLRVQIERNAVLIAKDQESIMAALASAQARASEAENAPLAQRIDFPEASVATDLMCKCGSVATAKRLNAALMDAVTRNTELQSTIATLESKLAHRATEATAQEVGALEERANAAERRLEVARAAMTRYVKESQKCSPAPTVANTIDDLTPLKKAVDQWIEVSEAKHECEQGVDSDDEFDSPPRRRGSLPTPRLRARVAIRRTHGPAPKIAPGAYKPASDEELRRRARVMGLSVSPFARASREE